MTDFAAWATELCSLLDAIELAIGDDGRLRELVGGRFDIAEKHGVKVVFHESASGELH